MKRPSAFTDQIPSPPDHPGSPVTIGFPSAHASDHGLDRPLGGLRARPSRRRRLLRRLPLLVLVPVLFGMLGGPAAPVGADELSDARARQNALAAQLQKQKADVAKINALQNDLSDQIASTRQQLSGINADLGAVRKSINQTAAKINAVKKTYAALVVQLNDLDVLLDKVTVEESVMTVNLRESKALLAERLRQAYDTDRTSMLETFLSGHSFTDVLTQVSYSIDMGEQDKALAEKIQNDQETLAAVHQTVLDTRATTDDVRLQTIAERTKLNAAMKALNVQRRQLKALEAQVANALEIQKAAYRKLAANKHNLKKAMAATNSAKAKLAKQISDLVAKAYAQGNIPSQYNGTLKWPMNGVVSQNFGCTGVVFEPPLGSCPHFHQGIDIVAPYGTPVHASGDGRIVYCGWNYADGADPAWIVIIAHSQSLETWYAHMVPSCPAAQGAVVHAGQTIGHEGNTGHSTGAHLHWAVRFNDEFVNPRLFL